MTKRLTGRNPLAYRGVEPLSPPNSVKFPRAPLITDLQFNIGDLWLYIDESNPAALIYEIWMLVALRQQEATWVKLYPSGTNGASSFPCDVGIAMDDDGVLNMFGTGGITTSGAGSTVTISLGGNVATQYDTDAGSAVPAAGVLNVLGGNHIDTAGAGNTLTISIDGDVATSFPTDDGTAVSVANELDVLGGDLIETSGAGNVVTVSVIDSAPGEAGYTILGSGGASAPAWGPIMSTDASITVTRTAASIDLIAAGGGAPGGPGGYAVVAQKLGTYNYTPVLDQEILYGENGFSITAVADNSAGAYNPGDGAGTPATYTAPVKGIYQINHYAFVIANPSTTAAYYMAQSFASVNGVTYYYDINPTRFGTNTFSSGSELFTAIPVCTLIVPALAGDVIRFGYTMDNVGLGSKLQFVNLTIFLINTY